jgi:hypothetical protein
LVFILLYEYVGVTVLVTPVGNVVILVVGVTVLVKLTDTVFVLDNLDDIEYVGLVDCVFVAILLFVTEFVLTEDFELSTDLVKVVEAVEDLERPAEAVYVVDTVDVLELLDEPVFVGD